MNIKDVVHDREDNDPDDGIVILTPDKTIDEWDVTDEETVADQNPEYDPDEPVIIIAYHHHLEGQIDWQNMDANDLFEAVCDASIPFYAFPKSRLAVLEEPDIQGGSS